MSGTTEKKHGHGGRPPRCPGGCAYLGRVRIGRDRIAWLEFERRRSGMSLSELIELAVDALIGEIAPRD